METEEEQHMTTLLCMGFPDAVAIRKALRMAKNDINEAVALLTNESPGLGYGYEPMESGPGPSGDGESSGRSGSGSGGFDPPPAYHDVVEGEKNNDENGNCSRGNVEFPTTNLYELESRVFTDHWSIPYKREESLGKCLIASTCLAKLSLADADENCKRFIDRCMPEAFKKLLTSSAVHKWGTEIHEGIYNMLMLLVDLVAERVKLEPIPVGLLGVLTMAFNPDNEYHFKNRMKACQRNWSEVFGEGSMFAVSLSSSFQKEPHGWLVDLVNRFGELGGFAAIQSKLGSEEIEIGCVSALVQPLGVCAEYLNSSLVQPMLDPVIHKMITYVQNVEEKDLKDKRLVSIPELLSAIKLLCMRFQPDLVTVVDDLRLDILLRMLKTPHFSAKMNSLKEVTKLIEDSTVSKTVKNAIDTDKLLDWLVENSVLSIALEGNIDQAQYCDRIKGIIELLGSKLSLDELSKIWRIQVGSNCSSGSEGEPTTLHAGICVKQNCVSIKDTIIAREALSLLVTCLQLRCQQLGSFYNLPCVSDFIIDILLGSPSGEIRSVACDQLYTLSQTDTSAYPDLHKPNLFLLRVVLTAQLPLWSPTSIMRGINQRLLSQCAEYFDLRCQLLDDLTSTEMEQLQISPAAMLEDEINWLDNFEPTWTAELETSEADNILQAGHLRLIKTLLSLCGNDKEQLGPSLIQQLLDDFLFRASRIILNSNNPTGSSSISQQDFHPKCSTVSSRLAAYEVLVMLADSSLGNLQLITRELLSMHHQADPTLTKEFDYLPPVDSRSSSGFVGLKNGGATCYMNAVFQQLYMQPGLAEAFLTIEEDTENPEESVFYQVQSLFGHLMESKLQYYVPENFWKIFKMWNKELFVREQQDAYEFFTSLVDQLDEHLKKINREQIFKNTFQGIFSDQKICKDCPHRYEREETFMALNLGVTSCQSLEISLDQFVRGEVLEGSNAYYCEKCKEKRTTVKRTCIKSLPSVLVIHLMRFGFDWESGRSIKYDEQIKFPWVLNMEPYTVSGMARQDSTSEHGENGRGGEQGGSPRKKVTISENYELVGVVVHSGQAHAGHYYSFIKDRRGSAKGKWYKFNDDVVEEFDMNDETLEYECFGGEYRPKVYDQSNPYPDVRRRYWNAYMLFYQRISDQNSPVLPKKSRVSVMRQEAEDLTLSAPSSPEVSPQSSPRPPRANNDRLSLLTKLVRKGEKKGLFVEKMPARIYQMVRDENLKFMKNRDVYNSDYFNFTLSLASVNATKLKHPTYQAMAKVSLQLAIQFLFHTYLRTKKKLRVDTEEWIATIEALLSKSSEGCRWLIEYLVGSEGRELIKICLLESCVREVRIVVATILEKTLESALHYQDKGLDQLLEVLLSLLDKDVPENCKNCSQYFYLFSNFVQRGHKSCQLLLQHSAYMRMLIFLLGPSRQNNQNRRWSSAQAREFLHLHNTLALMVLHTDASGQRTVAPGQYKQSPPVSISMPGPLLALHGDIEALLFKPEGQPYLLEVMFAMRELSGPLSFLLEMITSCCFCNEPFSLGVLQLLKHQLETAPPHELKNIFQLLLEILVVEDPLQTQRLKYAFESEKGLLALMHQSNNVDSSRCYQCVKFLVTLAQKCSPAKDYFKENANHWSWAVQWLQKKMSEHYWTPQSNVSNETSTAKTFQRTISAQDTLAYATALLNEKEQSGSSNGSEESPANDNSDRSLRQGSESPMILGDSKSDLDDVDP
ncbi:ubiquitin carboxyl-terminal hydrolase 24 isoform X3 [Acipenser oxyrinchus oxyrinchus]|uniref:Ubiquitin carboxyl-terminal hydrolase 24 n=1 Tax=Acipenser oxyrinchus oxyrinchus TaxID=40147 RepID=A0AAD8D7S7_ACIOX|nr:ubiquitin carboxyl-terminal hydrolase 24 isoform X3 [Acipenser oxyrinchus oxyrinchus]